MTTALIVVEAGAIVLLGVLVAGLLRSHSAILRRLRTVEVGAVAAPTSTRPELHGTAVDGTPLDVVVRGVPHRTVLVFLTSSCVTCRGVWDALRSGAASQLPGGTHPVIVTEDAARERVTRLRSLAPPAVPLLLSSAVWEQYGVEEAPEAVILDGSGAIVARAGVTSWEDTIRLVRDSP